MTPKISPKNKHLGRIKSVSGTSGKKGTCKPNFLARFKHLDHCANCYGVACETRFPDLRASLKFNDNLLEKDPRAWINGLVRMLNGSRAPKNRRYFRFNVFGDFRDREHFEAAVLVARLCPSWKFLAFTKRFDVIRSAAFIPPNLAIVLSIKHETKYPPARLNRLPRAYCFRIGQRDGRYSKDRRFHMAKLCSKEKNCIDCGCFCWETLKKYEKDVKFQERGTNSVDPAMEDKP